MEKRRIRAPFFVVNPKAYLFGDAVTELARHADELAAKYDLDVFFTAQAVDLLRIREIGKHLIVTAQHMDGINPGKGMGHVLPDGLAAAGVQATFLNHAEHAVSVAALAKTIKRADELGILTIVCADSVAEARALAMLGPDVIVCEPTALIGTGKVSDASYMEETRQTIKAISPTTMVLQAAGISSGKNVYDALMSGADGTGATSGIVAAADPHAMLEEMIQAVDCVRAARM